MILQQSTLSILSQCSSVFFSFGVTFGCSHRFQQFQLCFTRARTNCLLIQCCQTCIARSITELMLNAVALNAILDVFRTLSVVEFASDVSTAARFVQVILWLSNIVNYKIAWCFQNRIKLKLEVHVSGMFVVIVIVVLFYGPSKINTHHKTSMFFKRDHQHFFLSISKVDEFLFAGFTPMGIHTAIQKLGSIQVKYSTRRNKVESLMLFLLLLSTLVVPYLAFLSICLVFFSVV